MLPIAANLMARHVDFGHEGQGHRPLRILLFVLFLALIGTVIWLVVREVQRRRVQPLAAPPSGGVAVTAAPDASVEQVRMRYARGEITRDEYVQLTQDLGGSSGTT
jgi:hypothetical protein